MTATENITSQQAREIYNYYSGRGRDGVSDLSLTGSRANQDAVSERANINLLLITERSFGHVYTAPNSYQRRDIDGRYPGIEVFTARFVQKLGLPDLMLDLLIVSPQLVIDEFNRETPARFNAILSAIVMSTPLYKTLITQELDNAISYFRSLNTQDFRAEVARHKKSGLGSLWGSTDVE